MRVPRELKPYFEGEVDALATVRTSLSGGLGTVWLVASDRRLHAFELDGLLGDPEPFELAPRRPLSLEREGIDNRLVVRTADGAEHVLSPSTWEAEAIAEVMARAEAGPAPTPAAEPQALITTREPERSPPPVPPVPLPPPTPIRRLVEPRDRRPVARPGEARSSRGRGWLVVAGLLVVGVGAAVWVLTASDVFGPDAWCGDGIVSTYQGAVEVEAPIVTNPQGATGPVCDDGGSGWNGTFDIADDGNAPEHGICQALGYERALSVTWGGGPGEASPVMPHADNWSCHDYECVAGSGTSTDNCTQDEMLVAITCEREVREECDEGELNGDTPGARCRSDCTWPRCGDGVVDGSEACDDGNQLDRDGCSNDCRVAVCGDGIRQTAIGERCDDGNTVDGDGCSSACQREDGTCNLLLISDDRTALSTIRGILAGTGVSYETSDNRPNASSDLDTLSDFDLVIFYHQSRAMLAQEVEALTAHLDRGGRLLLTGYDSLGFPTDAAGAGVVGLTVSGDGPWDGNCQVTATSHPALDGPFGSYPAGFTFQVTETDHDQVSAAGHPGTTTLISVAGGTAKLTVAEGIGTGGGTAYYWNGNRGASDWASQGPARNIFLNLLDAECGVANVVGSGRTPPK